ncbi:MAG: bifunctional salicylyl-CoA 5-hydroxylase/oxidoreductase [Polyangiaceae bacterium]
MRIVCIGGGPAGLYVAILAKLRHPDWDIELFERNRAHDTFGFGVVFSDATMDNLRAADPITYDRITEQFWHWDEIDTHFGGERLRSTGHGFAGMSRMKLLLLLQERCRELGVRMHFETEVDDLEAFRENADLVIGADGLASFVREELADEFGPRIEMGPNRFVWLGTTVPFEAFTFYFKENAHGMFRVHAYRYEPKMSTFIVECTDQTFANTGLDENDEDATAAYVAELFADELQGHPLLKNRSIWRRFPTVHTDRWHSDNLVLIGDAVHTAHFSIGSGTKLAMEDAIALVDSLDQHGDLSEALGQYEAARRPDVESLQRAAQASLEWFEETERYMGLAPLQFNFSMLTRSLRVSHEGLRERDPALIKEIDAWFANHATAQMGDALKAPIPSDTPPMFTPYRLRDMVLPNRVVVSPMCMYSADDGTVDDWHLVHLGSRAIGGAGLIITEMTDTSRDGRITPGCAGMYNPKHVIAWKRITDFVHAHSEAKIGLQLAHAGRKGATKRMWDGIDEPLDADDWPLLSASALPYLPHSQTPRAMTREDMDTVKDDFVRSAQMGHEAGFDMLELHLAHGYLLASFLSPLTNHRDDEYGGDMVRRLRYPLEVFDAVRSVWPAQKPISVRISATDWAPGGNSGADAVEIARALQTHGCDIIDVSAGQTTADAKPRYGRLFQTPFSDRIRLELGIPTMTVGNISSYTDVNSILAAGRADLCVLARAHLYNPYWTRHAAKSLGHHQAWPDQYDPMNRYTPRFD